LTHGYTNGYTTPMKTAISIPDDLFEAGEKLARKLKVSRSQLYQQALTRYLQQQGSDIVRESLDRVYSKESNRGLDPLIRIIGEQIIKEEDW
jgi:antitoxin MazE6